MAKKPTYQELEKKVKTLEKKTITFKKAKRNLKSSLAKKNGLAEFNKEPEMAVEVIEQKDAEQQPVERILIAEHIFRKAIENSIPSGITGIDLEGRQIYINQAFCDMVGWSEKELLESKYPFAYWPQETINSLKDSFELVVRGNIPYEGIELPFWRKNGTSFWGLVTSSDLHDSKGKTIGQLISVADISKQKQVEDSMRDLSSRLVNAQESERKLVSHELHDSIGGKLTAIKYSLEKIKYEFEKGSNTLITSLDDVMSIVQDTIEETQRIYRNLHPTIIDDLGLEAAINSVCRETKEIYSQIEIKSRIGITEENIPDPLKILIYRILQEAMNNIVKHSRADQVDIFLKQNDVMELVIEDNGVGFDLNEIREKEPHERGFGLNNIKERTELFGGSLTVISKPGEGTTIKAAWQINLS
jgi:PAS domain S-box-containing protein